MTEKMVGSKLHVNMCLSDRGLLLLSAPAKRLVQQMRLYAWSCAISRAYYISFWRHAQLKLTYCWRLKAMQTRFLFRRIHHIIVRSPQSVEYTSVAHYGA